MICVKTLNASFTVQIPKYISQFIIQANYTPFRFVMFSCCSTTFALILQCFRSSIQLFFSPNNVYLSRVRSSSCPSLISSCANVKLLCSSPLPRAKNVPNKNRWWSLSAPPFPEPQKMVSLLHSHLPIQQ